MNEIDAARPYTMTSAPRLAAMAGALRRIDAANIAGDIVECGVWRGGNIILARLVSPARTCWLYDTFAGMTRPGALDISSGGQVAAERYQVKKAAGIGWCSASVQDVRRNLAATATLDETRLRFVVGDVAQTLRDPANLPERIALLRLDTDWHASTRTELEVLFPRLVQGGVLIVDDYGHWRGARRAVDDYFAGRNAKFEPIDYSAIMMVKP